MSVPNVGIITEQGDLGIGFDPLNEADASAYENAPVVEEATKPAKKSKKKAEEEVTGE